MNDALFKNPTFTLANDISAICQPLNHLKINTFSHAKVDHNRDFSFICNNPGFIELYFQKRYFNYDIHTDVNRFGRYVIWDDIPRAGKTLEMEFDVMPFGIRHTFTIIEKNQTGVDFYHFSSSVESKTFNQVYLANLDLLHLFINHFKKTTTENKKLSEAYNQKFSVDKEADGFTIAENGFYIPNEKKLEFRFMLRKPNLSSREQECLFYCARGLSAKEIAEKLGLSFRTVETYLEKAKFKFNVKSKSDLIGKWFEYYALIG